MGSSAEENLVQSSRCNDPFLSGMPILTHILAQNGRVWLSIEEYADIASQCGVEGMMLKVATRFLHETGSIRYFGEMHVERDSRSGMTFEVGRRGSVER